MKKILPALLIGASLTAQISIIEVDNTSGSGITLTNNGRTTQVREGESKGVSLSLVQIRSDGLLQDIVLNRPPKIPERALKLCVRGKLFYMWVDARGVVLAGERDQGMPHDVALSSTVLKLSPQEQAMLITCALVVSQDGVRVTKK